LAAEEFPKGCKKPENQPLFGCPATLKNLIFEPQFHVDR
jgi:hypothetical protein